MVMTMVIGGQKRLAAKFSTARGYLGDGRLVTRLLVAAAVVLVPLAAASAVAAVAAAELRTASVETQSSISDVADLNNVNHLQAQLRQLRSAIVRTNNRIRSNGSCPLSTPGWLRFAGCARPARGCPPTGSWRTAGDPGGRRAQRGSRTERIACQ